MTQSLTARDGMQSVFRSLETLEAIAAAQPVRVSELARTVGLPKTTVARIVRTLATAGWIAPVGSAGDSGWVLTPRALAVGSSVIRQVDLREIARPIIARLGHETDENIHLSSPDGDSLILIEKVASSRAVQTVANVGDRVPMHLTASGWAFMSRLPEQDIPNYLPKRLTATTDLTITDRSQLLDAIRNVTQVGYAVNPGHWRPDVAAIGAAIVNSAGFPIGAISISMPRYRLTEDLPERYGALVRDATEAVSQELTRRS